MDSPFPAHFYDLWKTFFSADYRIFNDISEELFNTDLYPLQRKNELRDVIKELRWGIEVKEQQPIRAFMEIGSDKCSTLYHWLKAFPLTELAIACDIRGTPFADLFEKEFPTTKFLWINGSSRTNETLCSISKFLGDRKLDFLFIDGDKICFGDDFDRYSPFLAQHGVALFHDVFDDGSKMQRDFMDRSAQYSRIGAIINTSDCDKQKIKKLLGMPEGSNAYTDWLKTWDHISCGFGLIWTGSKK